MKLILVAVGVLAVVLAIGWWFHSGPKPAIHVATPRSAEAVPQEYDAPDTTTEEPPPPDPAPPAPEAVQLAVSHWRGGQGAAPPIEPLTGSYRSWGAEAGGTAVDHALIELHGQGRLEAAAAALEGWAARDLAAAAEYLLSIHTPGQDYLVNAMARWYAAADPEAALSWAFRAPVELEREAAQHAMLTWLSNDASEAALWAGNLAANSPLNQLGERTAVWEAWSALSHESLDTARAWVETLPGGAGKNVTADAMIDQWATVDAAAATDWRLRQQGLDQARGTLAQHLVHQDEAMARSILDTIQDPFAKEEATFLVERIRSANP